MISDYFKKQIAYMIWEYRRDNSIGGTEKTDWDLADKFIRGDTHRLDSFLDTEFNKQFTEKMKVWTI